MNKALFLDRDGVINYWTPEIDTIKTISDCKILPGVEEALTRAHNAGFKIIVITNQPGVAKGFITDRDVWMIHHYLQQSLHYIDAFYYCPHHPEKGHPGEVKKYKIICNCRKPKPGMIYLAANEAQIDITKSYMIGDKQTDIDTGIAAGCKENFLVTAEKSLLDIVNIILEEREKT